MGCSASTRSERTTGLQWGAFIGDAPRRTRGGLTDRFGGKYILVGGLTLFALGMGYIDWVAEADSGRWSVLPGLIVAGVGLGFT
jgi:hypothetical protein